MISLLANAVASCCGASGGGCSCFPCTCTTCICIYSVSSVALLTVLGVVRVVLNKDKVDIVGDDPAARAKIASVLKAASYEVREVAVEQFPVVEGAKLSRRERKILTLLLTHPGESVSRETILSECWGFHYWGTTRTVDQHIANLRKKLTVTIESVRGEGYRIVKGREE